ncbi:MAG: hypothetical protein KF753_22430 [Caldilineaceae bacterium]|nr:hypothetical protein [Caldilineaceae bacterium]
MQRRIHLLSLAFFSLLTLALSWPLPLRIFDFVPGVAQWAYDESTFIWNIWYFKHALIDNLSTPLHSELIYYPLGIDLILYTYNFFNALIAQPLHLAVGLIFSSNVTVLFSTALSGYGAFLLARYLLLAERRRQTADGLIPSSRHPVILSSLLAGILYAFASNRAIYATLGHYDMVTTQWIPFYALTLLQALDGRRGPAARRRSAILAGVFFAFNGLAEMITALFLAIFTVIVVVERILSTQRCKEAKTQGNLPRRRRDAEEKNTDEPTHVSRLTFHALPNLQSLASNLTIIVLVAFLLWSPALLPILRQFLTSDFSLKGWGEAIPLSTDLWGWFTPTVLHPLFGGDLVAELRRVQLRALEGSGVTGFRDINTVFIGWVSGALALLGLIVYRRRLRAWAWTALTFGLFTLGPFLQINGQYRFDLDGVETSFPLPYALLHYLPIIKANRAPNRNSVLLMLAVAVLAAYGGYWVMGRLGDWVRRQQTADRGRQVVVGGSVAFVLVGAILFEHLALPLPLSDHRVPAVYEQIAADPAPVSVMHAPLGWRNSFGVFGAERTILQYYQSVHGKPMIGGNISRASDFKMGYFQRLPLFQAIREVEFNGLVGEGLAAAAQAQAAELMYLYNVGYVLLMPAIPQRFPYADHWQVTWDFYKATLPLEEAPFWTGDGIEAYRVVQPPGADNFQIQLGQPDTFAYRAEGWDESPVDTPYGLPGIWAVARESCLLLPLRGVDATADYPVRVQVRPFDYPGSDTQQVTAIVNGTRLAEQVLVNDWQTVEWSVPGRGLVDSVNRLCLEWGYNAVPRRVLGGNRLIGSTGVELPIDADIKAFAEGGFISLFDEAGSQTDASAGRRGVNVTVLDSHGGVVDAAGFDTAANTFESEKLAAYIADIPAGAPVLVATRGDAAAFLTDDALTALNSLGGDVTLDKLRGNYLALAGIKGAALGSAAQVIDPYEAFLRISLNRDRRTLAGAVGEVAIGRLGD